MLEQSRDVLKGKRASENVEEGWGKRAKWRCENHGGFLYSICYVALLVTELVLWIKVALLWRQAPSASNHLISTLLPCILPCLFLPVFYLLHSLSKSKLRWQESLLLVIPPAPAAIHIRLLYLRCKGQDVSRLDLAGRLAGLAQSTCMSGPLVLMSLVAAIGKAVEPDQVNITGLDRHFYEYGMQLLAASVSLVQMMISSVRYNERGASSAVKLLVAIPFMFTTISFRMVGMAVLFTFFESAWVCVAMLLLFILNAIAVQLSSGGRLCQKWYHHWVGEDDLVGHPRSEPGGPSLAACILLAIASIFVPCGYNQDRELGHAHGKGWKLVIVSWLGYVAVLSTVISHALSFYVPNKYTGLLNVDMKMEIPKTAINVNIPDMMGGTKFGFVQPKMRMQMIADDPGQAMLETSEMLDRLIAVIVPTVLAVITAPFAILRVLLLGWDCHLSRQTQASRVSTSTLSRSVSGQTDSVKRAGKARNCSVVCCSLAAMMMYVVVMIVLMGAYVYMGIHAHKPPLEINSAL